MSPADFPVPLFSPTPGRLLARGLPWVEELERDCRIDELEEFFLSKNERESVAGTTTSERPPNQLRANRRHDICKARSAADSLTEERFSLAVKGLSASPIGRTTRNVAMQHLTSRQARHPIPIRRFLTLHSIPVAAFALPRIGLAPFVLVAENRSLAPAKASSTKPLLPITAPSVK